MKFKRGDRIRCIKSEPVTGRITKGKMYTVVISDTPIHCGIIDDIGTYYNYKVDRFELIKDILPDDLFQL